MCFKFIRKVVLLIMDRNRFDECMSIGEEECDILLNQVTPNLVEKKKDERDSLMFHKIDARLLELPQVASVIQEVNSGYYSQEEALFCLINLLGHQLLAVSDDVELYEACKSVEDNIEDYMGKVAFQILTMVDSEDGEEEDNDS